MQRREKVFLHPMKFCWHYLELKMSMDLPCNPAYMCMYNI